MIFFQEIIGKPSVLKSSTKDGVHYISLVGLMTHASYTTCANIGNFFVRRMKPFLQRNHRHHGNVLTLSSTICVRWP